MTDLTEQLADILVVQLPDGLLAYAECLTDLRPRGALMASLRDRLALPQVQLPIDSTEPAEPAERVEGSQLNSNAHLLIVSLGAKSGPLSSPWSDRPVAHQLGDELVQ